MVGDHILCTAMRQNLPACQTLGYLNGEASKLVITSERFNWGPLSVSPGFPPFETLRAVSIVERLKTCGNDGARTPGLCGHADYPRLHFGSAAPGHDVVRPARLSAALLASAAATPTGNSLPQ